MIKFNFAEWLKREMTSAAAVGGGGGSFSSDIAGYARPLLARPLKRKYPPRITK